MKKYLICLMILAIILSGAYTINAGEQNSKADSKVIENINEKGKTLVYVEFNDNINQKGVLAEAKNDILNLNTEGFRYDLEDKISLEVNSEDLRELERDSRVKSIKQVGEKHLFLSQSVPLINASATWSLKENGINLTGAGETVCILDSGVNYSHSNLGGCYGNNSLSSNCKIWGGWDYVNSDDNPYDDNGHGTHVSGIVAANGSINGVAPEARIIMIKVCNSGGACADSYIRAGIDWCVNNASVFNISVISLSLGGGLYSDYCDYQDDASNITLGINNAVAKNISVVIAAGNGLNNVGPGNATALASPACIQNATPISATTKADAIDTSYADRSTAMLQLLAPGTSITSTKMGGGSESRSGTSMATPHAAGTIAIMRQYLRAKGRTNTTQQIESILNSTGKLIYDSASNFNYSRIDVYGAVALLNSNSAPTIAVVSPENRTYNARQIVVNISAEDILIRSIWWYNGTDNLTYSNPAAYNFSEGSNNIIAYTNNSAGNLNYTNVSFFVDSINPSISFVSANTTNGTITSPNISVYIIAGDTNLKNITINFYNSTGIINSTNSTTSPFSVNFTDLSDGIYYFNATAYDTIGNLNFTETRNATVNVRPPILTITSPANNSWYNAFRFNVTLNEEGFCWFSTDNGLTNQSMTNYSSSVYYFINTSVTESSANNGYNVTFYCNDSINNENSSSLLFFGVDKTSPSVSPASPSDSASYTGTQTIGFQFTVTDNVNITQCALIVGSSIVYNTSAINASTNIISKEVSSGNNYTWYVNCTDIGGNVGKSASRTLTVNSASSSGSSTGGTTTLTNQTTTVIPAYIVNSTDLAKGFTKAYYSGDSLKFNIISSAGISESHTMKIDYVGGGYSNITITSNPIKITLYQGQETRLSLASKDYYDLYIKLENVKGAKANFTVKSIHETIPVINTGITASAIKNVTNVSIINTNVTSNQTTKEEQKEKVGKLSLYVVYIILAVILVRLAIYLFVRWRRRRKLRGR